MSQQFNDYCVVAEGYHDKFEQEVKRLIAQGWTPHGSVSAALTEIDGSPFPLFSQAMVKGSANNELPVFKQWLLANQQTESLKNFQALLLKVHLDNDFPSGYLSFGDLSAFLDSKKADHMTKVSIFLLWEMYIRDNWGKITSREICDYRQHLMTIIQLINGEQRQQVEETLMKIDDISDKTAINNDFKNGIKW